MEEFRLGNFPAGRSIIKNYNQGIIDKKTINKILSFFHTIDLTIKNIKNIKYKEYIFNLVKKDKMQTIEKMEVPDIIKSHMKNVLTSKIRVALRKRNKTL